MLKFDRLGRGKKFSCREYRQWELVTIAGARAGQMMAESSSKNRPGSKMQEVPMTMASEKVVVLLWKPTAHPTANLDSRTCFPPIRLTWVDLNAISNPRLLAVRQPTAALVWHLRSFLSYSSHNGGTPFSVGSRSFRSSSSFDGGENDDTTLEEVDFPSSTDAHGVFITHRQNTRMRAIEVVNSYCGIS